MPKLCVFAGTTEGREIAEFLAEQSADVTVCVATEYGETLLPQGEGRHISARPLPPPSRNPPFSQTPEAG